MELDTIRSDVRPGPRGPISSAERKRRITNNLCLYGGCLGHRAAECPLLLARKSTQGNVSGN